tara:strand:+ start:193 stop:567 length:375 start_codon:yes stop_codon:yes gene_type:complete
MTHISKAIKILTSAVEKNEIPTTEDLLVIHRILNQLLENLVDDEDSGGEDVSSVEESCSDDDYSSDDDDDEDCCVSCDSESSERRSYKTARGKGYALYIKNGGTRSGWSGKSDKYKDTYYERKK